MCDGTQALSGHPRPIKLGPCTQVAHSATRAADRRQQRLLPSLHPAVALLPSHRDVCNSDHKSKSVGGQARKEPQEPQVCVPGSTVEAQSGQQGTAVSYSPRKTAAPTWYQLPTLSWPSLATYLTQSLAPRQSLSGWPRRVCHESVGIL